MIPPHSFFFFFFSLSFLRLCCSFLSTAWPTKKIQPFLCLLWNSLKLKHANTSLIPHYHQFFAAMIEPFMLLTSLRFVNVDVCSRFVCFSDRIERASD
ncbi:hypothetical protein BD289DRAFT_242500 [Coniella lustricola]|uniref:Secreted protein n=1 Tax=Coniella lustricola TaxID=2025994 RepID=A0A2T3A9C5_9PEZI|nr:hypothetical protein BD289DRAFT_242500 [Coniella lustricola]